MARRHGRKKRFSRVDALVCGAVGALVATSVIRELRRPAEERTWQGKVAGVPYDYRPPTVDRLRATWWAPEDDKLVKPTAYGLGWDLNVGRVVKLASAAMSAPESSSPNGSTAGHP
ncbi:MAG TPA: hypothetical protein VE287_06195 [Actinopolymorphaceae bacterium]|nr:hypothetical protein [Actinopolymorphaceae bacterium]